MLSLLPSLCRLRVSAQARVVLAQSGIFSRWCSASRKLAALVWRRAVWWTVWKSTSAVLPEPSSPSETQQGIGNSSLSFHQVRS